MIPRSFCSGLKVMMQLEAPRILKEPVRWRVFKFQVGFPVCQSGNRVGHVKGRLMDQTFQTGSSFFNGVECYTCFVHVWFSSLKENLEWDNGDGFL